MGGGGNRIITNYNYGFLSLDNTAVEDDDYNYFIENLVLLDQKDKLNVLIPEDYWDEQYQYYNHIADIIQVNVSDGGRIILQYSSSNSLNDTLVISCIRKNEENEPYVCNLLRGPDIIEIIDEYLVTFLMPDEFYIDDYTSDVLLIFLEEI